MKIFFHWDSVAFNNKQQPTYEEKFKDDLQTLFETNPKEAHIYFDNYTPSLLSGFIKNESDKRLCGFKCELLGNNTTSYDFG